MIRSAFVDDHFPAGLCAHILVTDSLARVHAVAALLNVLLLLNVTVAIWLALGILH